MNAHATHETQKIAIPYYGKLSRPTLGLERVYFIMDRTESDARHTQVSIGVWDAKEDATLPEWLEHNGVRSVICLERPSETITGQMFEHGIFVDGDLGTEARFHLAAMQLV